MDATYILSSCAVAGLIVYLGSKVLEALRAQWKIQSLGFATIKGLPLLGNSLQLMKVFGAAPGVPFSVYTMEVLIGLGNALKDVFYLSLGPICYIVLPKAEHVELILGDNKEVNKSDDYLFFHPWLGTGLITSSYTKWRKHRKMLTPAFHFRILDEFQPIINDYSEVLVKKLESEVGKSFFNLEPYLTKCALDIIAGTALGVNVGAQKEANSPYVTALHSISGSIFLRFLSPWLWPDFLFWISPTGREMSKNLKIISTFIKKVVRDKKELLHNSDYKDITNVDSDNIGYQKVRHAFLEMMILHNMVNKDDQFSDQDIEDEVNTFTFAGHDTTTVCMIWTCYMIGLYPDVQTKLQEEIEDVFGKDSQRPCTLEDVKNLNYLERVIKETLRLYPSVPYIGRKLNEDFAIKDVTIPKGTPVVVCPAALHRDPDAFPNPELFDPDRFLETRHPFAYVPFSAGPRNCIGQRFALLEMKTVLCNILRNFKLTSLDPRDKVLSSSEIIMRPSKPIRTKIERRH